MYQDGASCQVDALHHLPRQHDGLVPPVVEALVPISARIYRFPSLNPISKLRGARTSESLQADKAGGVQTCMQERAQ